MSRLSRAARTSTADAQPITTSAVEPIAPAAEPIAPAVDVIPAVEGDDIDQAPVVAGDLTPDTTITPDTGFVLEEHRRPEQAGTRLMQDAPVNSKVLVLGDAAYFATPDGVTKLSADDHLFALFPTGVWFRRTGPDAFLGFLPEGAGRDVREQKFVATTMYDLVRLMSTAITG